jgi:hypothetical protein
VSAAGTSTGVGRRKSTRTVLAAHPASTPAVYPPNATPGRTAEDGAP